MLNVVLIVFLDKVKFGCFVFVELYKSVRIFCLLSFVNFIRLIGLFLIGVKFILKLFVWIMGLSGVCIVIVIELVMECVVFINLMCILLKLIIFFVLIVNSFIEFKFMLNFISFILISLSVSFVL